MKFVHSSQKHIRPVSHNSTYRKSTLSQVLHAEDKTNLFQGVFRGKCVSTQLRQYESVSQDNPITPESIQILLRKHEKKLQKSNPKSTKTVEQLLEENEQIKRQNNRLCEQNMKIKARSHLQKKLQLGEQSKKTIIDFSKEKYWSSNEQNFRVQGIKQQHQLLKKQYQKLEKLLKIEKTKNYETGQPQLKIYLTELESENKRLKQYLQASLQSKQISQTLPILTSTKPNQIPSKLQSSRSKIIKQQKRSPLKLKNSQLQPQNQKLLQLQQKVQKLSQQVSQKSAKIRLLQTLITSKDNSEHHINCKFRKIRKQNQQLRLSENKARADYHTIQRKLQVLNIKMKEYFTKQFNAALSQNQLRLRQKDEIIADLQYKIRVIEDNQPNSIKQKSMILPTNMNSSSLVNRDRRKSSVDLQNFKVFIKDRDKSKDQVNLVSKRYASHQNEGRIMQQSYHNIIDGQQSAQIQIKLTQTKLKSSSKPKQQKPMRNPLRANINHNSQCKRVKKVQWSDVKDIGQILKFRMIGHKIQSNNIKQIFNKKSTFTQDSNRSKSMNSGLLYDYDSMENRHDDDQNNNQHQMWSNQYMNMRQAIQILRRYPFNLSEGQAIMLARYAIEDIQDQSQPIFYSELTQNKRAIVSSIIKSLIGPYEIPNESASNFKQFIQKLSKYRQALQSMLKSYHPSGRVSVNKLFQLMVGMGIQMGEQEKDYIIGKMVCHQSNISQVQGVDLRNLKYSCLFEQEQ